MEVENVMHQQHKYTANNIMMIIGIHVLELRDEEKNAKKIIPVRIAAYAVAKRKPENSGLLKIETLPLRYRWQQANWEMVIKLV